MRMYVWLDIRYFSHSQLWQVKIFFFEIFTTSIFMWICLNTCEHSCLKLAKQNINWCQWRLKDQLPVFSGSGYFFLLFISSSHELKKINLQVYVNDTKNTFSVFPHQFLDLNKLATNNSRSNTNTCITWKATILSEMSLSMKWAKICQKDIRRRAHCFWCCCCTAAAEFSINLPFCMNEGGGWEGSRQQHAAGSPLNDCHRPTLGARVGAWPTQTRHALRPTHKTHVSNLNPPCSRLPAGQPQGPARRAAHLPQAPTWTIS